MIYEISDMRKVFALFEKWEETLIWSCLQGIMGNIYADDIKNPTAAMAVIGDFTFLRENQTWSSSLISLLGVPKPL